MSPASSAACMPNLRIIELGQTIAIRSGRRYPRLMLLLPVADGSQPHRPKQHKPRMLASFPGTGN